MTRIAATVLLTVLLGGTAAAASPADPQAAPTPPPGTPGHTEVVVYPILGWVPIFGAHALLPQQPDLPGEPPGTGGGSSTNTSGSLNGAAMAGVSVLSPNWVLHLDLLWAGLSSEVQRPHAKVTTDIVFGGVYGGRRIGHGVVVMGGVRRLAVDLGVQIDPLPKFERKPGIWDPLVGLAWNGTLGRRWTVTLDGMAGGFGVGADVDASAHARLNWNVATHFRMVFGYGLLYLKLSDGIGDRTFTTRQMLHGPELGIGIPF